jgi:sigma-B regulation protein RsbU (phosphoserine phosphatase)
VPTLPEREAGAGERPLRADDIAAARDIQMSILPPEMPAVSGYDLYGCLRPAEETGGDMFDLVSLEQGVFVLLGDATGHGFGPALCATQMQAMFRVAFRVGAGLEQAYIHVNNQLDEDLPDDRFVTAFAGFLDPQRHRVSYFSAGQGPLLHYRAAQRCCQWYGPTTFPLGTVAVERAGPSRSLELAPGDVLAVLSDGIYEFEGRGGTFGRERVAALVDDLGAGPMEVLAEHLLEALGNFGGGGAQQDDLTIVLVKRLALAEP